MAARTLVGLDIGSRSIRAVETRHTKGRATVVRFGTSNLPLGAVRAGVIEDDKAVISALRELWETARFGTRKVILGVTNRQVVVREMAVSNVPERELRKSLPAQVRQVLPLPVEESLLDFCRTDEPSGQTVRGLLIAAPRAAVLTAVQTTERAGLRVARVDLAAFALLRAAARLDGKVEALVDIGARATSVVVHEDGKPLIVRTVPRGGDEITEAMAKRLDMEMSEAEAVKHRVGLGEEASEKIAAVIRDAIRPLINEIRSSFAYLTSAEQHVQIARLALSGGGSRLAGLEQLLHEQLGVEVIQADPVAHLRQGPAPGGSGSGTGNQGKEDPLLAKLVAEQASSAVSIGLTLGEAA